LDRAGKIKQPKGVLLIIEGQRKNKGGNFAPGKKDEGLRGKRKKERCIDNEPWFQLTGPRGKGCSIL